MTQHVKIFVTAAYSLIVPLSVRAQSSGLLPECDPIPGREESCGVSHLFELAVNIYNFALGLAALVAFLFIVWGGIQMLIAYYSGGAEQNVENAKSTLRNGIVGFIIVLAAYLIVQTMLNLLGVDDIDQYFDGSVFNGN